MVTVFCVVWDFVLVFFVVGNFILVFCIVMNFLVVVCVVVDLEVVSGSVGAGSEPSVQSMLKAQSQPLILLLKTRPP